MKWTWFISVLLFLVMFFLHGCGKGPDADTLALIEASDAVCLAEVETCYDRGDVMVLRCTVREDFLGNISTLGRDVHRDDRVTVYVAVTEEWYDRVFKVREKEYWAYGLILFLDLREKNYKEGKWGDGYRWNLFVPQGGEESIRWEGGDASALRYLETLRAYGKAHPREAEDWTFQYPEGLWSGIPSYYT